MIDATLGRRQLKKAIWPQGNRSRADTGREVQKVVCTSFCCSKRRADTKQIKEIFKKKSPMSGAGEIQYEGSGADNNSHRQQQKRNAVFLFIIFFPLFSPESTPSDMTCTSQTNLTPPFSFQSVQYSLAHIPGSRAHHKLSEKK